MYCRDMAKDLRRFFLRSPALGSPFINIFKTAGVNVSDPDIAAPVVICSDKFIDHLRQKNFIPIKKTCLLKHITIINQKKITEEAFYIGSIKRVRFYRLKVKNGFSCMDGLSVLLCNLSKQSLHHYKATVTIVMTKGNFNVHPNCPANYITCEESYEQDC